MQSHYFRQNVSLILSQKEKRRRDLEHEKKEGEARERLEVLCNSRLFRQNVILTQSRKEKRQKELEREKEKDAREPREKLEVRCNLTSSGRHSNPNAEGEEAELAWA